MTISVISAIYLINIDPLN